VYFALLILFLSAAVRGTNAATKDRDKPQILASYRFNYLGVIGLERLRHGIEKAFA